MYDDDCDSEDDSDDEDEDRVVFEIGTVKDSKTDVSSVSPSSIGTDVRDALEDSVWDNL